MAISVPREAVLQETRQARWLLEEFALAHTHSKNQTGKYLVTLMLDEMKASQTGDANLKNYIETKTYLNCNDLVSVNVHFLSCSLQTPCCDKILFTDRNKNLKFL